MTNSQQVDKAIRKLVHLNDDINEKRFYYTRATFPYALLLNNFRTVDHWRAYFEAQSNNMVDIDLILSIPELAGFFRDWSIGNNMLWGVDDTSPENLFYIDLIKVCPMLAEYGWYNDQPDTGVRTMIKRLFETKNGFSFMNELTTLYLTTSYAFKIAYLVDCLLAKMKNVSEQSKVVYEPKKTRSGKVY